MKGERVVAGLRCSEVIACLSDYVDGELSDDELKHVRAHVSACDLCERFGGEFASLVRAMRGVTAHELDADAAERLATVLRKSG